MFAVGLLRSRAVPVWAALGIAAWPPLHVVGLVFFGNEVPQVIGAVLQAVGFAGCAGVLLQRRQTETCEALSSVKGAPLQSATRSSSTSPASRAIRSSSAGQT